MRAPSKEERVAQEIVRRIEQVAGGEFHIALRIDLIEAPVALTWYYNCPCGEVSGYHLLIDAALSRYLDEEHVARFIAVQVDVALTSMRIHVRGEGNEPNF